MSLAFRKKYSPFSLLQADAEKGHGPRSALARPGISKWVLVGPNGTCTSDATKKAAV